MGVSKNDGAPKSSVLIGFSIINHPFWGKHPYFLETPIWAVFVCDNLPLAGKYPAKEAFFSKKGPDSGPAT